MLFKGKGKALKGIFGLMVVATALAGCNGSSGDSSSSSTDSASSAASIGQTVNSSMGTIALSSATYKANAASSAIVTVNRSGSGSGEASVHYTTVNGSATAGADYTATSGSLVWKDGDTSARSVAVPVGSSAHGKMFAISLTSVEGQAAYGDPSSATIQVAATTASSSSGGTSSSTSSSSGGSSSGTTAASSGSSSGSTVASGSSSSGSTKASSSSSGTTSSSSGTTASTGTASLQWTAPTDDTSGAVLQNLKGYNIYYGTSSGSMTNKIAITTAGITNYVIQNMQSGTWYFAMTAVNTSGVESVLTSTVQASL